MLGSEGGEVSRVGAPRAFLIELLELGRLGAWAQQQARLPGEHTPQVGDVGDSGVG